MVGNERVGVFVEEKTFNEDVSLEFTETEVPKPTDLSFSEDAKIPPPPITATNTISNPLGNQGLIRFQLDVVSAEKAETVASFDKPVRVVIDVRTLMKDLNPVYGEFYLAYQDEKDPNVWYDVPVTLSQESGLYSADVMHFSSWEAGVRPQRWNPTWNPPAVSEFSGAATYSYPIEVPPGRNGLQPDVTLSYSSRSVDGLIQDPEAGTVGTDWSLAEIKIVWVGVKYQFDTSNLPETYHPNQFSLVMNGTGHRLSPAPGANTATDSVVRYYAKDAAGMYIERHYDASHTSTDGIYWIVVTADGTRYRLGYQPEAEEYQTAPYHYYITIDGHGGHSGYTSAIAWNVDTITDAYGNQMTYHYYTRTTNETITYWDGANWTNKVFTTRSSRIATIKYNFPGRITTLPAPNTVGQLSSPGTRIEFRANSGDAGGQYGKPVTSIYIYHGNSTNPASEYRIDSGNVGIASPGCINSDISPWGPRYSNTYRVNSIRHWTNTNSDPTDADPGYALPAATFTYTPLEYFYGQDDKNCFSFYYMTGYKNGYGGSVDFTYTKDNRSDGDYVYHFYGNYTFPSIGFNYVVTTIKVNDGRNPDVVTQYAYERPCYGQWGSNVGNFLTPIYCHTPGVNAVGNIVGFYKTTATTKNYSGSPINVKVTQFEQVDNLTNKAQHPAIGRPKQVDVFLANGTTLMSRTINYYATATFGSTYFTYTSQTTNEQFSNGSSTPAVSNKVTYSYDPNYQKDNGVPTQFGNLTHISEFDDINATVPYRTTRRWYDPNTTRWIVNKPRAEGLYEGNGWVFISGTWNYYDGSTAIGTQPSQGFITRTRTVHEVPCGSESGCSTAYKTIDTTFGKDAFGNQTSITTFSDYGYRSINASFAQVVNTFPSVGRTTSITYDSDYNLYPVQVSNDLGHLTKFDVYGFKNVAGAQISLSGFQEQPGLLAVVKDPNNIETKYEYDPFGRLHAVYDAYSFSGYGDTSPWNGNPLSLYKYWDNTWNNGTVYLNPSGNAPFEITVQTRIGSFPAPANSSSGYAFNEQTFFDGFGRTIQTRGTWYWVEGQSLSREIITSMAYNAQGLVSCQTAPYDVPFYTDRGGVWPASPFVTDSCTSKPHTFNTYDALGRPLTSTAPDGSVTENLYAVTNTITVGGFSKLSRVQARDANGHLTNQFTNSRGQLVLVRNNTGSAWGSYATYLDTQYYYNLQGNLTMVQQRDPNDSGTGALHMTTTMTYDNFGRKIGMVDPDMGTWTYQYNAVGSLISQKDARGNPLCFRYDDLDRLLNRTQDSTPADACPTTPPTSGSNHLASYTYDPTNGKGQIATVSWGPTPAQNKDTFTYDTLGRLTKQTRLIDNRSYAMETTSFDALHRPLTIKYPTNEIVTLTYDHEGEQTLKAGADTLVGNVTYNGRGQLVLFDRGGNAPDTTFLYHPQNDASGGGLGDSNFRLKTIQHGAAGTTNAFPDFTYEYDKVGNITKMIALSTAGTDTQTFTYDHLNRLLTAGATGNVANYSQSYAYNKLGNITSGPSGTYNYNEVTWNTNCTNLPTQSLPHAVRKIGSYYFCYDKNGNMVTRSDSTGTYTQVFDVENRLISVTPSGGGTTSFAYDANGIRVKTTRPSGSIVYTPFPNFEEEFRPGGQASLVAPDGVMAAPALVERENSGNWLASVNLGTFPLMTARTSLILFLVLACLTLVCLIVLARRPLSFHQRQLAWRLFTSLFALTVFVFLLSMAQTVRAANDKGRDIQTRQLGPVGSPWVSADIGTVGVTGSADETSGTFTIDGGGADIDGTEDAFHFVYQPLNGDGSITANVASLSGGGARPKAGLMMRDSLADDAAHVSAVVQGSRIRLLDRASTGGNTTDVPGYTQGAPEWIRIERSGSTFTLSRSNDGSSWAVMDTRTISMGTMIYIGMAVTGNSTTTLATGVFDNVATTGSGATPTPTATNTPLPTNTPTATNTPVSTNTPTPTNTPPPSPTPAPDVWIKRSSYSIAGQTVAFRVTGDPANSGLFYVLSDHLGSTSLLVNSSGGTVTGSTTRYLPFGGYRGTAPSQSITDRDFTGQKENMELGLLYYQARFYVPGIGRFASSDTLVPDPGNPQAYNRYSYVENRPLNFNDPTGHCKKPGECVVTGGGGSDPHYTADAIIRVFPSDDDPMAYTREKYGQHTGTWDAFFTATASVFCNTCDNLMTAERVVSGEAGALEIGAAALPIVPGVVGRFGDEVLGFVGKYFDEAVDFINGLCSFSAETLVMTENGPVPISEVEPDTLVLAYNEETGEIGYYPVTAVWEHVDPVIVTLTIDGEQIETTPEHPFYTIEGEWLAAAELQIGDELRTAEWETGIVEFINITVAPQPMYNFTVATAHTYFVSDKQLLVHNDCLGDSGPRVLREIIEEATTMGTKPLSVSEAETVLDWAQEMDYPGWRAKFGDVSGDNWIGGPHIHIPQSVNSGHVPVQPGVQPRTNPNLNPWKR